MKITPSTLQPNLIPITAEDIQEGMAIDGTPVANTPATPAADLNIQVSANGSVMSIGNLQSTNFNVGVAGWRLDSNGNIEANDGNFRGDISGATGTFTGSVTTSAIIATGGSIGAFTINATSIFTGTEDHSGYTANAGDLTIYSNGTVASIHGKEFYIGTDGKLTCTSITATGTINAQAGYLSAGVYIDSATAIACESAGLNVGVLGHIRGGQTDYNTGTGWWIGYDTTTYKLSIGVSNGNNMIWDGSALKITGSINGSTFKNEYTAGEAIDASSTPLAVYLKASDTKVYKANAGNAEDVANFLGFVADGQSVSADASVNVIYKGIVPGLTGLTSTAYYYMTDTDGVISQTPGTNIRACGWADSTTDLILDKTLVSSFVSDSLKVSADTERTEGDSYTKVKEITIVKTGTYRIKWDMKSSFDVVPDVYSRVYKNGTGFGAAVHNHSTSYGTHSQDLVFAKGDLCQLYIQGNNNGSRTCYIRNFRLYFDYAIDNNLPTVDID